MGWKAAISPLENVKYLKIALEDLMSVCVCVCVCVCVIYCIK